MLGKSWDVLGLRVFHLSPEVTEIVAIPSSFGPTVSAFLHGPTLACLAFSVPHRRSEKSVRERDEWSGRRMELCTRRLHWGKVVL